MAKLETLITSSIALLVVFVVVLIAAIVKRRKLLFGLAGFSFLLLVCTGLYTLYYGFFLGVDTTLEVAEKIFPSFNSDTPDTEANRKNFRRFLNTEVTPDVKNLYCFDDAIGADADYIFAFNCDSATAQNLIETNNLEKDTTVGNNPEGLQHDFPWWNKKRIGELQSYSFNSSEKGKGFHKLFWYGGEAWKAYYFAYSL